VNNLKLPGRSVEALENEIKLVKAINKNINMNFLLEKCAKICLKKILHPEENIHWKHI
jgi:hypothetical protein